MKSESELPFPTFPNSSSFPTPAASASRSSSSSSSSSSASPSPSSHPRTSYSIPPPYHPVVRLGSGKLEKPLSAGDRDDERELAKNRSIIIMMMIMMIMMMMMMMNIIIIIIIMNLMRRISRISIFEEA